jgi:hypothetical protein
MYLPQCLSFAEFKHLRVDTISIGDRVALTSHVLILQAADAFIITLSLDYAPQSESGDMVRSQGPLEQLCSASVKSGPGKGRETFMIWWWQIGIPNSGSCFSSAGSINLAYPPSG